MSRPSRFVYVEREVAIQKLGVTAENRGPESRPGLNEHAAVRSKLSCAYSTFVRMEIVARRSGISRQGNDLTMRWG